MILHKLKILAGSLALFVSVGLVVLNMQPVWASTYAIPYAIANDASLLPGMIVVANADMHVRPANKDEDSVVLGVVASLPANSLPSGYVGVTSSGLASVLVSDLSGTIAKGDRVAVSPITGVGMKAVSSGWVIGVAQDSFESSGAESAQQQVSSGGETITAHVRAVPVLLSMTHYDPQGGVVIGTAQGIVDLVAGHSVSIEKTVTALIIFGIALIIMIAMIYASVKNSLISIGRNPMASRLILRALTKTLLYMLIVVIVSMTIIYIVVIS